MCNKTRTRCFFQTRAAVAAAAVLMGLMAGFSGVDPARAQKAGVAAPGAVAIPGFWDPRRRPERPDLSRVTLIRFLTENDYPPFNYPGPDGNPAGFNVDLARMICEELQIACTIQMRRFDTLITSLAENRGDAVIASIAITEKTRGQVDFTDPYYRTPARFVSRREQVFDEGCSGRRHCARGVSQGPVH
jgi:polar amino acid transport system substrate-binding protein